MKTKRKLLSCLMAAVILLTMLPCAAFGASMENADETTFYVGSKEKLIDAMAVINANDTGKHYIIELTADLEIGEDDLKNNNYFRRNETTIYGNGHTLTWCAVTNCLFYIGGSGESAILNLGSKDDPIKSELTIVSSPYKSPDGSVDPTNEFFIMSQGCTLNMYDGVTLKGNITGDGGLGMAVRVGDDNRVDYSGTTFNMYGGMIEDCEDIFHSFYGAVVVLQNAVFNMYGGKIKNNSGACIAGAVYLYNSASFNLYGGLISGNSVTRYGGAVWLGPSANFNMSEG